MKKLITFALIVGVGLAVAVAVAGNVYDRDTQAIVANGEWTNNEFPYSSVELKRIWIVGNGKANDTVTVTRVTSDRVYTQACGSVTIASSIGNTATFTASHLKYGDILRFVSTASTGSTAIVDFEVQKH
jgi:L-aminopeptidase/D-esterase-like protein